MGGLSEYESRHLVEHLIQGGRLDDVRRLLTWETPEGSNAWYQWLRSSGLVAEYPVHVEMALSAAQRHALLDGERLAEHTLADEYRYALMLTSINSLSANMPPALLGVMVSQGLISSADALSYARRTSDVIQRARGLAGILAAVSGANRDSLRDEVIQTALEIESGDDVSRDDMAYGAEILAGLVPEAPQNDRMRIIEWLLRRLSETDNYRFGDALARVQNYLTLEQAHSLFDILSKSRQELVRDPLLSVVAAQADDALSQRVLKDVRAVSFSRRRADLLEKIAPRLPVAERTRAHAEASAAALEWSAPEQLVELARARAPAQRKELLAAALNAARGNDSATRPVILLEVASLLDDPRQRPELVEEAIASMTGLKLPAWAAQLGRLAQLAVPLPEHQRTRLLEHILTSARALRDFEKVQALAQIADTLDAPQQGVLVEEAYAVFHSLWNSVSREFALRALAPRLAPDQLRAALDKLSTVDDAAALQAAQAALAPQCMHGTSDQEVSAVLQAATAIEHGQSRVDVLLELARQLDGDSRARVLEAVLDAAESSGGDEVATVTATGPLLKGAPQATWLRAHQMATRFDDPLTALVALAEVAEDARTRRQTLQEAVSHARESRDAEALSYVAQATAGAKRRALFAEAVEIARDDIKRAEDGARKWRLPYGRLNVASLAAVAARLPARQRAAITARVVQECDRPPAPHNIPQSYSSEEKAQALASIARGEPPASRRKLLQRAVEYANDIQLLKETLAWLAPQLDEPERSVALCDAIAEARPHDGYDLWHLITVALRAMPPLAAYGVLRHPPGTLATLTRKNLLAEIEALAPVIAATQGPSAAAEVSAVVADVARWWP
jgi:hypothetical protein